MEAGRDFNWTVLDAIYGVQAAWNSYPVIIKNCFNHCGFMPTAPACEMMITLMMTSPLSS